VYERKITKMADDPNDHHVDDSLFDLARQVKTLTEDLQPATYAGCNTPQLAAALEPIVATVKSVHHLMQSVLAELLKVNHTAKLANFKAENHIPSSQQDYTARHPESEPKSVPAYIMAGLTLEQIGYRRATVMPTFKSHPSDDNAEVKSMREQRDHVYESHRDRWDHNRGTGVTFNKMPDNIKVRLHTPACMNTHVCMIYCVYTLVSTMHKLYFLSCTLRSKLSRR
jgi:hypothetical protein